MRAILASILLLGTVAHAVPLTLQHQGRLFDQAGVPLDGAYDLRFAIYDAEVGGTELWAEDKPGVSFEAGYFAERLGALDVDTFATNETLWFDLAVDGGAPTARVPLDSVPFALAAGWADVAGEVASGTDLDAGSATLSGPLSGTDASFTGSVQIGSSTATCDASASGSLRFNEVDLALELCQEDTWVAVAGGRPGTAANPARTCRDLLAARPGVPSGPYWIDPSGAAPLSVFCDMETLGGGWTLCGKFDRDNGAGETSLRAPFARAPNNTADLAGITTFSAATASLDCRTLIQAGATEVLSAGTDSGLPWGAGRIVSIPDEVRGNPAGLWDVARDEDGVGTCVREVNNTRDLSGTPLDNTDGANFLSTRAALLGDGAWWTTQGRSGANFSNAGQPDCANTSRNTIHWSWVDAGGGLDTHTCGATDGELTIGTGCSQFSGWAPPTYRYNLMLFR